MVECLKKVHGNKLMSAHKDLFFAWHANATEREPMNLFSPRSDPERERPFLPYHPYHMLLNGDYNAMPHMMGYTDKEGTTALSPVVAVVAMYYFLRSEINSAHVTSTTTSREF